MDSIRVVIVDDQVILCQGMAVCLCREPHIEVVGVASNTAETVRLVREQSPDVVLMDVFLDGESGLDVTRRLRADYPGLRILAVTAHSDDEIVAEMLQAGADGYVLKDITIAALAQAIRAVALGQFVLDADVAHSWVQLAHQEAPARPDTKLSAREVEMLRLLSVGATSKQIGQELKLNVCTVANHRARLLAKLGARNIVEAIAWAVNRGLITSHLGPVLTPARETQVSRL